MSSRVSGPEWFTVDPFGGTVGTARPRALPGAGPFTTMSRRHQGRGGCSGDRGQSLAEPTGVALLGAGQGLQPLGDLDEPLVPGGLGEARVHLGVLVG